MPFTLLSVDDEMDMQELLRQKFRTQIRANELFFYHATNGKDALDILSQHADIDMILADINMPVMDGLTFLAEVAKLNRPMLKVVMISAYGDMRNIRLAMNRGAFDFINKPIDFSDLEATILKTKERIDFLKNQQVELERLALLENEIKAAAHIQSSLLPRINGRLPRFDEVQIGSFIKPAKYVGGDFYDVFQLDDKHLGFVIADVSGKGIAAAAFMLVSHTAMSIFANQYIEPNKVLELANNYLEHDNKESMFTTTFYGILNVETGEFIYSNGGHNPPLHINNQSYSFIERTANPALGIISDLEYGIRSIHLQPGDKIIMFTDGVSEAQNLMNEEYGENRIVETIRNNSALSPKELNEKLFENLEKFRNTAMQFDDITIFSFQWK